MSALRLRTLPNFDANFPAHDQGGIAIAGDDGCRPKGNLRLLETLAEFRARLRARGNCLEVAERQRVVQLLAQEILVGGDNITIRHSIPLPGLSPDSNHGVRPSPNRTSPILVHFVFCVTAVYIPVFAK